MNLRTMAALLLVLVATSVSARTSPQSFPVAVSENASDVLRVEDGQLAGIAAPLYQCVFERTELAFSFTSMPPWPGPCSISSKGKLPRWCLWRNPKKGTDMGYLPGP